MDNKEAMAWLDGHVNMEKGASVNDVPGLALPARRLEPPSLNRMRRLLAFLGDPQLDVDVVHLTGTNGKGSTARMLSALLLAAGQRVGTYTSPHLERLNERIALDGEPIGNAELAATLTDVALAETATGEACSFFELVTAAAYRWFQDLAVDVGVIEVGMGGTWDATNAADGLVSVITNVELDHMEYFGSTRADIAREKSGIFKEGGVAIIGDTDPEIVALLTALAQERGVADIWQRGDQFDCVSNRLALAGRALVLRTPSRTYTDVFIPLHGRHQGDNAAIALAAAEAFLGEALDPEVVLAGFASVVNPGRLEVVGRRPLVMLDGAHNPAGARAAAAALDEEFATIEGRVVVMGLLDGRDEVEMVSALCTGARRVIAVAPPSPRAMDPQRIVDAARALGVEPTVAPNVARALADGLAAAEETDLLLVTGSLYLVGAARPLLRKK